MVSNQMKARGRNESRHLFEKFNGTQDDMRSPVPTSSTKSVEDTALRKLLQTVFSKGRAEHIPTQSFQSLSIFPADPDSRVYAEAACPRGEGILLDGYVLVPIPTQDQDPPRFLRESNPLANGSGLKNIE